MTAKGVEKYIIEHWKILHNDQGVPMKEIGTCRDITEQKRDEEKLKESESRYRQIVETAQEGIWLIDENNKTILRKKCQTKLKSTHLCYKVYSSQKLFIIEYHTFRPFALWVA